MIPELNLLVLSYLELEEVLTFCDNNALLRDRVIKIYFKNLPDDIYYEALKNNLMTVKYLYELGVRNIPFFITDHVCGNGHLKMVKYLYSLGIKPTPVAINIASIHGHLDIMKYLYSIGVLPTENAIDTCISSALTNGHLETVEFLQNTHTALVQ